MRHDPRAREYIFPHQVARPGGGAWKAGERVWLTPEQYSGLDPTIAARMVDVHEYERRKAALLEREDNSPRAKPPGLDEVGRAKLAGRRARRRKMLREYANTMVGQDEVEDK